MKPDYILRAFDQDEIEYIAENRGLDSNLSKGDSEDIYVREVKFTDKSVTEALNDGSLSIDQLIDMFRR